MTVLTGDSGDMFKDVHLIGGAISYHILISVQKYLRVREKIQRYIDMHYIIL